VAMTMAKRRTTDLCSDPTQLVIDSAPDEIEREKAQRAYRLNVVQIPTLRILGFYLLTICIFLQNLFILKLFSWTRFFEMASLVMSYSLSSWLILYLGFEKIKIFYQLPLSCTGCLHIDIVIYFSGGEKSLLFWLIEMHVAHPINTSFK
jgi:hypothetical protein